jgi:methionine-rich copper-binding protein CopC
MKMVLRALLGATASLVIAATAQAHAALWSADPAAGGVAHGSPAKLHLIFTEAIAGKFSGVALTDPAGAAVAISPASLDPADPKALTVPIKADLKPGVYKVRWHAVASDDGHRSAGAYSFTVK